jgi:iron(II)-dependent oxidoreductase
VTANDQWEPVIRVFNQVEMVLVPAGCFQMGNKDGMAEEQPVHQVCFDKPFWFDLTEVTANQFANFLNGQSEPVDSYEGWLSFEYQPLREHDYQLELKDGFWAPGYKGGQRPQEHVTWVGANDYCLWRGARLPTEAEWEFAARGPESFIYPWGDELVMENFFIAKPTPPDVGSYPQGASWVGAMDMVGSEFEWTSSLYMPYPYHPDDGREVSYEEDSKSFRVFRGSPWYHSYQQFDNVTMTARYEGGTDYAYWYHGFRCALSVE